MLYRRGLINSLFEAACLHRAGISRRHSKLPLSACDLIAGLSYARLQAIRQVRLKVRMRIACRGIADGVPAAQDGQSGPAVLDVELALGQVERDSALEHHLRRRSGGGETRAPRNIGFQKSAVPKAFAHKDFVRFREKYRPTHARADAP